jgi:pimeloyl-ACP methyl ester carboxylesterase
MPAFGERAGVTTDEPAAAASAPGSSRRRRRIRRILTGVVVFLVVVAVVFFGGGGWYFAGEIRSGGLAVEHDVARYDLTVDAFEGGVVTLREAAGRPRNDVLRRNYTYGLRWPGGSGVLDPATAGTSERSMVRPLSVTSGTPPAPGSPAQLRRDVYTDPATAYHVAVSDVTYECAGGTCPAWRVPGAGTTWAVMVHGWRAARTEPLRALQSVLQANMPAMVISYRNDVGAPPDASGFYRFGATEWRDLHDAVSYAMRNGAQRVVLFGYSMGASVIASFLQHSTLADRVTGLVFDAPLLDFRRSTDYAAAQRQLPVVGLPIPPPLTWTAETIADLRFGIDWESIDYHDAGWLRVPTLVFHGTADDTVPIASSDELAARHPQLVREIRVDGASHVESWNADPKRYIAQVSNFLPTVVG